MASKIQMKRGRLSGDECTYIEKFKHKRTVEQIASHLRRPIHAIEKQLALEVNDVGEIQRAGLAGELENRPEWLQLKQQFDDEELEFYKYRYMQLISQFGRDDITPTEELQIFQLINFQIMGMQTMKERKPIVLQQKDCQRRLEKEYQLRDKLDEGSPEYKDCCKRISVLEERYSGIASALKAVNARNDGYSDKVNDILKQLKATRDQRKKVVDDGDKNFIGFLKKLTLEDQRSKIGREIEYMRIAADKEQKRLEAPHVYDDGFTDQPLLTPESVLDDYGTSLPPDPSNLKEVSVEG